MPTNSLFEGSGVALVTPFDDKGVNEAVLRELVEFQIEGGTSALIACGSTGEAATMSPEEQSQVIAVTAQAAKGRVPVIGGVGGSNTAEVVRLAANAESAGADGLLLSPPPYNIPTQQGIVAHFRAVMSGVSLPTIVYNVPSRTACNILPTTVAEIAEDEQVVGVKEASPDIAQAAKLCRLLADRIAIYSGNDDRVVPLMALGAVGVISVIANIAPRPLSEMVQAFADGDIVKARQIQLEYLPLIETLFSEPNPTPIKAAVAALGFNVGGLRLPLQAASPETVDRISALMGPLGLAKPVNRQDV